MINAKQKLVTESVIELKFAGMISVTCGFKIIPAVKYPIILGKPIRSKNIERKYPVKIITPK